MKKTLFVPLLVVITLTLIFSGCKKEAPNQPWLDEMPTEMSLNNVAPPKFALDETQFRVVIEQIKSVEILGKAREEKESAVGGGYEVEIKYDDKTVTYYFTAYGGDSKTKIVCRMDYKIDNGDWEKWSISKEDYFKVVDFLKTLK